MAVKGSKYARKHRIEANSDKSSCKTNIQNCDKDLWDILYNPISFVKNFQHLKYNRQIEMISLLQQIVVQGTTNTRSSIQKQFIEASSYHLNSIHKITQSSYDEGVYYPLSTDEKKLIRMDCYGSINKRHNHQLSELYKFFTNKEKKDRIQQSVVFKLGDYNLSKSPAWRVFAQFENFRKITPHMQKYFYENNINPDALKVMTVSDFCDAIYQAYKKNNNDDCAHFTQNGESLKQRHVKEFMQHCGNKLEEILESKGIDTRCVKSLCNAMRRFGVCDVNSIMVTETHYTPRILQDLKKAHFDISKMNVGDKIPQTFINSLIDNNQAYLILARDTHGNPLDKSALPSFELHHKHAVRFTANNGYLARSNYPNNLLLTESQIHARYFHLFDKIISNNQTQTFYSRLNVKNQEMCLLVGFSSKDIIYFDMEKSKSFLRRELEDKLHRVNYFDMMEERLKNEQLIAEKYGKNYSKSGINKAYNSWKEISEKINKDEDKMTLFKKWLLSAKKRKGR